MSLTSNGTTPDAIRNIVPPVASAPTCQLPLPRPPCPRGLDPKGQGQRTWPGAWQQIHRPAHPRDPTPANAASNARMTTAG